MLVRPEMYLHIDRDAFHHKGYILNSDKSHNS